MPDVGGAITKRERRVERATLPSTLAHVGQVPRSDEPGAGPWTLGGNLRRMTPVGRVMSLWTIPFAAAVLSPVAPESSIDAMRAMELASNRVPGFIFEVKLEEDEGEPVWEAVILTRQGRVMEVEVCGETGRILEVERVVSSEDLKELKPARTAFSARKIGERALSWRAGKIVEIEQDRGDDGRLTWDVYIHAKRDGKVHELSFDARTGDFLGIEVEEPAS
jgi:uncharacterized membrane protein YkoI